MSSSYPKMELLPSQDAVGDQRIFGTSGRTTSSVPFVSLNMHATTSGVSSTFRGVAPPAVSAEPAEAWTRATCTSWHSRLYCSSSDTVSAPGEHIDDGSVA